MQRHKSTKFHDVVSEHQIEFQKVPVSQKVKCDKRGWQEMKLEKASIVRS